MPSIRQNLRNSYLELHAEFHPAQERERVRNRMEDRLDDIRQSMIDSLGNVGAVDHPAIVRRIRAALDATGLWYLRSALMTILCSLHGEEAARRKVMSISHQFEGMLPQGLQSRPSPLDH
ncbi:MAG: hypothetical protein V4757_04600 [Pseudomonadota bacterium]